MKSLGRFVFAREPRLEFGAGSVSVLPRCLSDQEAARGGKFSAVAVVTGSASFKAGARGAAVLAALRGSGMPVFDFSVSGEPSPDFVDAAVRSLLESFPSGCADDIAVVGIGGGSAMDAGKAVAAMLPVAFEASISGRSVPSVQDYLEGVGKLTPTGRTSFYIAVPTTAGTGTEASKNAVISRIGEGGFKKSLRHDAYAPSVAVVDPELALGCPLAVSAASGLDAFTQLLEAYLSPACSPMVAALCESGMERFASSFPALLSDPSDLDARSGMAYAAYISGVALANAGLGSVHGLASPLGGRFPVPHGVVCGLLLLPAIRQNARILRASGDAGAESLAKYARAGYLVAGIDPYDRGKADRLDWGLGLLDSTVEKLADAAALPRLREFGMKNEHIDVLASKAAAKTNPVPLSAGDYAELLKAVL